MDCHVNSLRVRSKCDDCIPASVRSDSRLVRCQDTILSDCELVRIRRIDAVGVLEVVGHGGIGRRQPRVVREINLLIPVHVDSVRRQGDARHLGDAELEEGALRAVARTVEGEGLRRQVVLQAGGAVIHLKCNRLAVVSVGGTCEVAGNTEHEVVEVGSGGTFRCGIAVGVTCHDGADVAVDQGCNLVVGEVAGERGASDELGIDHGLSALTAREWRVDREVLCPCPDRDGEEGHCD